MKNLWKILVIVIIISIILGFITAAYQYNNPEITPNDEFFKVAIGPSPNIDASTWTLSIHGLVDTPLNLTYEDITSMPELDATVTLKCVSGPYGTAKWKGVKLKYILEMAGMQEGAREVIFYARDGYSSSLEMDDATRDDVLLAFEMNDETLPVDHGFPVRLVVPGKYGYKWVKWITAIEVIDYNYEGFWESRGWNDDATITPFTEWWLHSMFLSIAVVFGGMASISGIRFQKHDLILEGSSLSKRFISIIPMIYYLIFFPVIIYWLLTYYDFRGSLFATNHGKLALTVITLHVIGLFSGFAMRKGYKRLQTLHLFVNLLGFLIMLGAIMTGLILVYGSSV